VSLPFDLTIWGAVWMAVAVFGAAFVRGYSGFGSAALIIASASLVTNPLNFVAVVTFLDFLMTFQQWRGVRGHVDWGRITPLMLGAFAGVPLGLWLLTGIGVDAARIVISVYVLVMCAILLRGWTMERSAGRVAHAATGLVSGMANAAGAGGLPVAVFFAAQPIAAAAFRATLIAYFAALDIWTAPLLWSHGLVTRDSLLATALALPLMMLGIWLGGRHFFKAEPQEFRRFAILLLAGLAALGLVRSVL
jgi:uncharacterized membrane protein YfcA